MSRVGQLLIIATTVPVIFLAVMAVYRHLNITPSQSRTANHAQNYQTAQQLLDPSPTPTPGPSTITQISPDGKVELESTSRYQSAKTALLSLTVNHLTEKTSLQIIQDTVPNLTTWQLPFNSWSPDNEYFFIKETIDGQVAPSHRYLVYQASGEPFTDQPYIDVNQQFTQKVTNYQLEVITGWASPVLLLINTTQPDTNEPGPSFWFNVTTQSFTQLSTRF